MFDVIVLNPPYERNLHFTFLNNAIEHSNLYALSIEPCNWLILPYTQSVNPKSDKAKCIQGVEKFESNIEVIQGMEYFDAFIAPKLSINLINKQKVSPEIMVEIDGQTKSYKSVNDILLYGNDDIVMSVRQKLNDIIEHPEKYDMLSNHIRLNPQAKVGFHGKQDKKVKPNEDTSKWWCVNLAIVRGNTNKITGERGREFYTWLPNKRVPELYNTESKLCMVPFNSKEEAENFIDYLKSDFARTIQYLVKTDYNQNQCMYRLPWLDFSKKWTDSELFGLYGIAKKEAEHMRTLLPDYHARYSSGVTFEATDKESMIETEANVKRIERREQTGEVFTPKILVDKMLSKLPQDLFDAKHTFLDNSAGNGNFIIEIINRKLQNGVNYLDALNTVYATELMADNVEEMKNRILSVVKNCLDFNYDKAKSIIDKNIVCTDALLWDYEKWEIKKEG